MMKPFFLYSLFLLTISDYSLIAQDRFQHLYAIMGVHQTSESFSFNTDLNNKVLSTSMGAGNCYQFGRLQLGSEFYNATGEITNNSYKMEYKQFNSTLSIGYNLLRNKHLYIEPILGFYRTKNQINTHEKETLSSYQFNKNQYGLTPTLSITRFNKLGLSMGLKAGYSYAFSSPNWKNGINDERAPHHESENSFFLQLIIGGRINLKKKEKIMPEHTITPDQQLGNTPGKHIIAIPNKSTQLLTTIYPNANKETIILLHGGPGVPDEMLPVVKVLQQKYQVVTFLQRGIGKSQCKDNDYSMDAYISDIDAIANYLGINTFHLFGHSWGGLYAQIYSERKPEKVLSLFLCSPSSGSGNEWKQTQKEVMHFNKSKSSNKEWLAMGWNSMLGMLGNDKAYQKLFAKVLNIYHQDFQAVEWPDFYFSQIHAKPINKTMKSIKKYPSLNGFSQNIPAIITYGEYDIYGASQSQNLQRLSFITQEIIPNSGHIPWMHNPTYFQKVLVKFYQL